MPNKMLKGKGSICTNKYYIFSFWAQMGKGSYYRESNVLILHLVKSNWDNPVTGSARLISVWSYRKTMWFTS